MHVYVKVCLTCDIFHCMSFLLSVFLLQRRHGMLFKSCGVQKDFEAGDLNV